MEVVRGDVGNARLIIQGNGLDQVLLDVHQHLQQPLFIGLFGLRLHHPAFDRSDFKLLGRPRSIRRQRRLLDGFCKFRRKASVRSTRRIVSTHLFHHLRASVTSTSAVPGSVPTQPFSPNTPHAKIPNYNLALSN
jgi:hypothetical protein